MKNPVFTILTVVGARPQIIKAAAISRAIKNYNSDASIISKADASESNQAQADASKSNQAQADASESNQSQADASKSNQSQADAFKSNADNSKGCNIDVSRSIAASVNKIKEIKEIILHTGQHYDNNMSERFFEELDVPKPDFNLNVGSGLHGVQTGLMISGIEDILIKVMPDVIILYGDTNSTLAGAVAASKLHIPIVHIEAGLRSFNKSMPEEINRIMCDHASTLLFSPTVAGMSNLAREGFNLNAKPNYSIVNTGGYTIDNPGVFHTGDIMYDNSLYFAERADKVAPLDKIAGLGLKPDAYILATVHRDNNSDDAVRLNSIFRALVNIADGKGVASGGKGVNVVIPLHPRTAKILKQNLETELYKSVIERISLIPPASFFEMISLEKGAQMIITDSGGVQKEAFFFRKPCLILRPQTEWVEIVECGAALLVDADYEKIMAGYSLLSGYMNMSDQLQFPSIFGDGHASEAILKILLNEI